MGRLLKESSSVSILVHRHLRFRAPGRRRPPRRLRAPGAIGIGISAVSDGGRDREDKLSELHELLKERELQEFPKALSSVKRNSSSLGRIKECFEAKKLANEEDDILFVFNVEE